MGGTILLLDDVTASRIAAGEVVERPASAVKELIENALDAGAHSVTVILEDGGKRRIEVVDDGCAMDPEDAVLAVQRHATSKIRCADDLASIATLGFRGEALPSIASVSHFALTTKPAALQAGTRLIMHGGVLDRVEEVVCPNGTSVLVEDLFYNTPARLKFLKTTQTELGRCIEAVGMLAASHPSVVFRLIHNGQEVFATPGSGDLIGTLTRIWGRETARKLVRVSDDDPHLRVTGFIGTPDAARPGRTHQLFVVCGRPVRSRLLGHALEMAFRDTTPEARYPICCLHVDMDPTFVDVNVHPAKLEVRFRNEAEVHGAVLRSVRRALVEHGLMPEVRPQTPRAGSVSSGFGAGHPTQDVTEALLRGFAPLERGTIGVAPLGAEVNTSDANGSADETSLAQLLLGFKVLGQANNTFIVAATDDGIVVVDQHVAHERVLYERLTAQHTQHGVPSQRLAVPQTVSLGAAEYALVRDRVDEFRAAGWELEPFGGQALIVRAAPALVRAGQHEAVLRDMIDELVHQSVARRLVVDRDQVLIAHACRLAVKAGDPLSIEEMTGLLRQLAETRNPHFCPHGRPAAVLVSYSEVERRFKR